MSVVLFPSNLKTLDPVHRYGVSGAENIAAFLAKTGSLAAPMEIRGHKDHILALLQANKDRHVNVLYQENELHAFCTTALEDSQRRYRVGGLKTPGASAVVALAKLASRAIRGKYMSLHVTDSTGAAEAYGARESTYRRSVTFADLKSVVSAF